MLKTSRTEFELYKVGTFNRQRNEQDQIVIYKLSILKMNVLNINLYVCSFNVSCYNARKFKLGYIVRIMFTLTYNYKSI